MKNFIELIKVVIFMTGILCLVVLTVLSIINYDSLGRL